MGTSNKVDIMSGHHEWNSCGSAGMRTTAAPARLKGCVKAGNEKQWVAYHLVPKPKVVVVVLEYFTICAGTHYLWTY